MADFDGLATDAVSVVVDRCRRIADGITARAVDALAEHLHRLIEARFTEDEFGRAALAKVAERPDHEGSARALQAALVDALEEDEAFAHQVEDAVDEARRAGLVSQHFHGDASVTVGRMRRSQISLGPMTITNTRNLRIGVGAAALATLVILIALLRGGDGDSGGATGDSQGEGNDEAAQTENQGDQPGDSSLDQMQIDTMRFTYGPRDLTASIRNCGIETADDGTRVAFVEVIDEGLDLSVEADVRYSLDDEDVSRFDLWEWREDRRWSIEVLEGADITTDTLTIRAQWDDGTSGEFVARCANGFNTIQGAGA